MVWFFALLSLLLGPVAGAQMGASYGAALCRTGDSAPAWVALLPGSALLVPLVVSGLLAVWLWRRRGGRVRDGWAAAFAGGAWLLLCLMCFHVALDFQKLQAPVHAVPAWVAFLMPGIPYFLGVAILAGLALWRRKRRK